jgi:hypothetical protein
LLTKSQEIEALGARLVVIGNGAVFFMKGFLEDLDSDLEVYTDPSLETFTAMSLKRTVSGSLDPRILLKGIKAARSGFRQTAVQGDAMQLGGVFIVGVDGEIRYAYRSRFAGDHPDVAEVLAALTRFGD